MKTSDISMEPLLDIVAIKRYEKEVSKGGIIIPSSARESMKAAQGEIVAVGEDVHEKLKPGLKVVWGKSGIS